MPIRDGDPGRGHLPQRGRTVRDVRIRSRGLDCRDVMCWGGAIPAMGATAELFFEDQHEVGQKQEQMNRSEQDIRAPGGKRHHAHGEGQYQEDGIHCIDPEQNRGTGEEPNREDGRNGQANAGEYRSQQNVDRTLQLIGQGGAHRAERFGRQHQSCHQYSTQGWWRVPQPECVIDRDRHMFRQNNQGQ